MLLRQPTAQILKTLSLLLAVVIVFLLLGAKPAIASFSLDNSFGTGGEVNTTFGNQSGVAKVAVQPDGKIIVGGYASNGSHRNWKIIRYNTDGSIDTSFGTAGIITRDFGFDQVVQSIALQNDGKILIGGSDAGGTGQRIWTLARYLSNGTIDTSFDGGVIATPLGDDLFEILTNLKVQSDGKIIAFGYLRKNGDDTEYITLVRYNPDGSLDNNFGTEGIVEKNFGATYERGYKVAISQNNKIIVFGDYSPIGIFLLRYNSDGTLDNTFGSNGVVTDTAGWGGRDIAIQPDGKILVTGGVNSPNDTYVIRYNSNGSRDTSFGNNGIFVQSFSNQDDTANSLILQSDGKILLGGYEYNDIVSHNVFALRRLNTEGTLDTTFGDNGSFLTQTNSDSAITSLALQQDGKLLAAGNNGADWMIARYTEGLILHLQVPIFKQTDSPWASQVYNGANYWSPRNSTISDWGCALTSDAMILKYYGINKLPNGSALDPGTLNTWLKNNHGYDDGINSGYIIPPAISVLSKKAKQINNITAFDALETEVISGQNTQQLKEDLTNKMPAILGVNNNGHYVVATGINDNIFSINDPYYNYSDLTSYGNTFASLTRYIPSSTDLSYIVLSATPNVDISLQDTDGNIITNEFVQQPLVDPKTGKSSSQGSHIIFLKKPDSDIYKLIVSSSSASQYTLNTYAYDINGNVMATNQSGLVRNDVSDTYTINFDKDHAEKSKVKKNLAINFDNFIDDINEQYTLGNINKSVYKELLAKAKGIQKHAAKSKIFAKMELELMKMDIKIRKGKGIKPQATSVLLFDIQYLLKSL